MSTILYGLVKNDCRLLSSGSLIGRDRIVELVHYAVRMVKADLDAERALADDYGQSSCEMLATCFSKRWNKSMAFVNERREDREALEKRPDQVRQKVEVEA